MRWYVVQAGTTKGPIEQAELIKAIQGGALARGDTVCAEGSEEWVAIERHPRFAEEIPTPRADVPRVKTRRPIATRWQIASTVIASIALCGVGLLAWQMHHLHQVVVGRADAGLRHGDAALIELRKLTAPPRLLELSDIPHECSGLRDELRCTFTNPTDDSVATCAAGLLARNDNPRIKLTSGLLCTGRLGPFESKTLSIPWEGSNADELCFS